MSNVPKSIFEKLDAVDESKGFPKGTMRAIMHNEIRNREDFINDPAKYHYDVAADGKRRTKDGTISTAFGPFGILESTARKPGFGVGPLKDKSFDEQARFAADVLGAFAKKRGSLEKGLANYGDGPAYAARVMQHVAKGDLPTEIVKTPGNKTTAPVQVASLASAPAVSVQPAPSVTTPIQKSVQQVIPAPVTPVINPTQRLEEVAAKVIAPKKSPILIEDTPIAATPVFQPQQNNLINALTSFGQDSEVPQETQLQIAQLQNEAQEQAFHNHVNNLRQQELQSNPNLPSLMESLQSIAQIQAANAYE